MRVPVPPRDRRLREGSLIKACETGAAPLLAVLDAVTKAAKWQPKVAASKVSPENVVTGRGFAWSYTQNTLGAATIADVEVNKKTGKVTVTHVYEAFSPGLVINPALVENQIVGVVTQIVSRLLVEQLRFTSTRVTSWTS